jgi:beta-fructofuranosidase
LFRLPSAWTWDFWLADDGRDFHLFFLKASRALLDPDRRHWRATIGHAVSPDLLTWTEVDDALVAADSPAWDDLATWTGSVIRDGEGRWRMFYTGVDRAGGGLVQRIGAAVSDDLHTWHREGHDPLLQADHRWYETLEDQAWSDEAWRDPWVMPDPGGSGWHMLITARANTGPADARGVVGHATSPDLATWTVRPPLSRPDHGFGQLEVLQVAMVDDEFVVVFSCLGAELAAERRRPYQQPAGSGGIWAAPADGPLGPYHLEHAYRLTDESLYAGRLVQDRAGRWNLLAFHRLDADGAFLGGLSDPMPLGRTDSGHLQATGTKAPLDLTTTT